jgi:hypothetical protein
MFNIIAILRVQDTTKVSDLWQAVSYAFDSYVGHPLHLDKKYLDYANEIQHLASRITAQGAGKGTRSVKHSGRWPGLC